MNEQERRDLLKCASADLDVARQLLRSALGDLDAVGSPVPIERRRDRYNEAVKRVEAAKVGVRRWGGTP